jgi:hypothetical protein
MLIRSVVSTTCRLEIPLARFRRYARTLRGIMCTLPRPAEQVRTDFREALRISRRLAFR